MNQKVSSKQKISKSLSAYRTISEVADMINVPQHVLRFWETKFSQIRPVKGAGGRRYYRPEDVALIEQISLGLYKHGYTIKGLQKLLKDNRGKLEFNSLDSKPTDSDNNAMSKGMQTIGADQLQSEQRKLLKEAIDSLGQISDLLNTIQK